MRITKEHFFTTGQRLNIPQETLIIFWKGLKQQSPFAKYLYYLGALIIISAMTWLMSTAWLTFGGGGLFFIALAYGLFFGALGHFLWKKEEMHIPGGLLITCAVCMVPLAVYGLELYLGLSTPHRYPQLFTWIDQKWIPAEIATILIGALALKFYRFPFLLVPIYIAAWFLSMDSVKTDHGWVSIGFGLVLLITGYIQDKNEKPDFAFWSYLFGTFAFWGGLNALIWNKGHPELFLYLAVNILMMLLSIALNRSVLMVFGAMGLFAYLSYLALDLFAGSILLPFALTFLGLAIIVTGIIYQKIKRS